MPHLLEHKIRFIARDSGLILLYHYIGDQVPGTMNSTLHNTTPGVLQRHIEDLTPHFTFISLREFSQASSKRGLAAITFDDGYRNVLDNAVPVLEYCDCPATLFLNPMTFFKRWNWRDKIRYLIFHKLENEFAEWFPFQNKSGRFYRYSKNPENNSALLDQSLDQFLENHGGDLRGGDHCSELYCGYPYIQKQDLLNNHGLISYGNHSQNHYVLSSLTDQQQTAEIALAYQHLDEISDLSQSECFSAPFGDQNDINTLTYDLVKSAGYQSILMSRQALQPGQSTTNKVQLLERFMPRTEDIIEELTTRHKM